MERPDDATAAAPEIENGTAGFDRTADTREVLLKHLECLPATLDEVR
jgi:hypothetical protein